VKYRLTKTAGHDLDGIFLYWATRASLTVVERLIDNITERFHLLGEYPEAGRSADDIALGVKTFPAGKYLIYNRKFRGRIDILHVFHGARYQRSAFTKAGN
jgi:toxin ParE1/3/4